MAGGKKKAKSKASAEKQGADSKIRVADVLTSLERLGSKRVRDQMGSRFGITGPTAEKSFGVSMADLKTLAKKLGRNHELAVTLWDTGWYEARMLASLVDEPERVTPAQMDRWCRDFDNWAICDTVCFCLFNRTPHAFAKIKKWAGSREEFVKRGAFALLACVALHDKEADDDLFAECLPLIEREACDGRNFVKKGVLWALRGVAERGQAMREAAVMMARSLSDSPEPSARWVGKTALREILGRAARKRLSSKNRNAEG